MNERFTDEQVMSTLRAVVAERPDFIYEAPGDDTDECVYVHDGAPSCLVGHVMVRLGFDPEEFEPIEGQSPFQCQKDLDISRRAADALTAAQDKQDMDYTWSDALAAAEREYERE